MDYNDQNRGLYIIICWNIRRQDICFLVSGLFNFSHCHTGPLNRGVEIQHFSTLRIGISASNLNWILARGPAMKICCSFVDCASCNLVKMSFRVGDNRGFRRFGGSEGGNKTLRVCSFCSKNCIEQQALVQGIISQIYLYHIWQMTKK